MLENRRSVAAPSTPTPSPSPNPADPAGVASTRRYHGWTIARAGLLIQILHSGLVFNAFTLFAAQLQAEFRWSNSTFGGAFALNRAESGLLGPIQGWMTDHYGPRFVLRLGAVIMAAGLVLFSYMDSIAEFYITYLLIAMGSSLSGFITITVAIVHWFERKRSRALALSSMGFAVGGALAFGIGVAMDEIGWRSTARWSALLVLLIILPQSRHFHRRPADLGLEVDGEPPSTTAASDDGNPNHISAVHFTASEAMRTRAFWFISLGHASALLVVGASMAHLAIFLQDETALGAVHISIVIGTLPAVMGVGQLLGGFLGDRFDKRKLITLAMLGHGAGLLVLSVARDPALIWLFVALHGLAWGVRGPLQQAMRADYFGATDFGKIMGFSSLITMTGMVIGPITAGVIADVTGSFRLAFTILAIAAGLGSLWFLFATPPASPIREEANQPEDERSETGS